MTLRTTVILLRLFALAAFGTLGVFVLGVDPDALTLPGLGLFFFGVFLIIGASASLLLLLLAKRWLDPVAAEHYVGGALRQGVLLGAFVAGIAAARFAGFLVWWAALLYLAFLLLVEFTYRQLKRH
jgi:hypothetical protein